MRYDTVLIAWSLGLRIVEPGDVDTQCIEHAYLLRGELNLRFGTIYTYIVICYKATFVKILTIITTNSLMTERIPALRSVAWKKLFYLGLYFMKI